MSKSTHQQAPIRSIACWTLSKYIPGLLQFDEDHRFYPEIVQGILNRMEDSNKSVQQAACSALSCLIEESRFDIEPYVGDIIDKFVYVYPHYQYTSMGLLHDVMGTLFETLSSYMNNPVYLDAVMPVLIQRWNALSDDNPSLLQIFECLTSIAIAIRSGFIPYVEPVLDRSIRLAMNALAQYKVCDSTLSANSPPAIQGKPIFGGRAR